MFVDKFLMMADAAAIALNAGNAIAPNTDVIDLGASPTLRDLGAGEPIYLVLNVDTAFVGSGATVQFQLATDSVAALTTSKTVHIDTTAISIGTNNAAFAIDGYTLVYPLPLGVTYERYMGLWMTVASANVTAGKLNAYLTTHPPVNYALRDSTSIV